MSKIIALVVLLAAGMIALPYLYLGLPNSPLIPLGILGAAIVSFLYLIFGGSAHGAKGRSH
jgi:hypothetical protein